MVCGAFTNDYRMHKAGFWETRKIHSYGFSVEDWKTSHITKETKDVLAGRYGETTDPVNPDLHG